MRGRLSDAPRCMALHSLPCRPPEPAARGRSRPPMTIPPTAHRRARPARPREAPGPSSPCSDTLRHLVPLGGRGLAGLAVSTPGEWHACACACRSPAAMPPRPPPPARPAPGAPGALPAAPLCVRPAAGRPGVLCMAGRELRRASPSPAPPDAHQHCRSLMTPTLRGPASGWRGAASCPVAGPGWPCTLRCRRRPPSSRPRPRAAVVVDDIIRSYCCLYRPLPPACPLPPLSPVGPVQPRPSVPSGPSRRSRP